MRDFSSDIGFGPSSATPLWLDSKAAIDMTLDPVAFKKTKHILRAAQFLRDLVARDVVTLRHVPGKIMIAGDRRQGRHLPIIILPGTCVRC